MRAALPIIADIEAAWLQRLAPAGRDLRSALERAIDATISAPEPPASARPASAHT